VSGHEQLKTFCVSDVSGHEQLTTFCVSDLSGHEQLTKLCVSELHFVSMVTIVVVRYEVRLKKPMSLNRSKELIMESSGVRLLR
jgi:hypothetical protein